MLTIMSVCSNSIPHVYNIACKQPDCTVYGSIQKFANVAYHSDKHTMLVTLIDSEVGPHWSILEA